MLWRRHSQILLHEERLARLALQQEELYYQEQHLLDKKLLHYNRKRKRVDGDGACAFRSVSDQRFGTQEKHGVIRQAAVNQLLLFPNLYRRQFPTEADYLAYIFHLSRPRTWADCLALTAICDAYDVSLLVLVSDLDHDFEMYHPTWGPSDTIYSIVASHSHMDSVYRMRDPITLTPDRKRRMARTGMFFLPEVANSGLHVRFEE